MGLSTGALILLHTALPDACCCLDLLTTWQLDSKKQEAEVAMPLARWRVMVPVIPATQEAEVNGSFGASPGNSENLFLIKKKQQQQTKQKLPGLLNIKLTIGIQWNFWSFLLNKAVIYLAQIQGGGEIYPIS